MKRPKEFGTGGHHDPLGKRQAVSGAPEIDKFLEWMGGFYPRFSQLVGSIHTGNQLRLLHLTELPERAFDLPVIQFGTVFNPLVSMMSGIIICGKEFQ